MHHTLYLWLIIFVLFALTCKKSPTGNEKQLVRREMVIFASDRNGGNMNIWMMEKDGSNPRQLTFYPKGDYWPADISPDGKTLLFNRFDAHTLVTAIYQMPIDGPQPAEDDALVTGLTAAGNFFPDGQRFVFTLFTWISDTSGHEAIYIADLRDSSAVQISPYGVANWDPRVSPDGLKICFNQFSDVPANIQLAIMDNDGQNRITLTSAEQGLYAYVGRFSTDGEKVFFTMNRPIGSKDDLYFFCLSNGMIIHVTGENINDCSNPYPDTSGSKIYFRCGGGANPNENSEIFVVDIDGKNYTQLTDNAFRDDMPVVSVVEFLE